jgi:hypothetical protein
MKKIVAAIVCIYFLNSCAPKYGCPSDGRNIGAEKLASGDPKALKASEKSKYKIAGIY